MDQRGKDGGRYLPSSIFPMGNQNLCLTPSMSNGSRVPREESIAPDAHPNRAATPFLDLISGDPMEVDTTVLKDVSKSSSLNSDLVEPMHRFANRQRRDSFIKIPHSTYQALLQGKVSSYSSHSQFSSLSIRIVQPKIVSFLLPSEVQGHNVSVQIPEPSECHSTTTIVDNDEFKVVDDTTCLV